MGTENGSVYLWISQQVVPRIGNLKAVHKELTAVARKHSGQYDFVEWEIVEK